MPILEIAAIGTFCLLLINTVFVLLMKFNDFVHVERDMGTIKVGIQDLQERVSYLEGREGVRRPTRRRKSKASKGKTTK